MSLSVEYKIGTMRVRLWPPGTRDAPGWAVAVSDFWIPGVYADEQTARYAAELARTVDDAALQAVQDRVNGTSADPGEWLVTMGMLEAEFGAR